MFGNSNKINAISFDYAKKLGLKILKTNIETQKINGFALETFGMIIVDLQIEDKGNKFKFF